MVKKILVFTILLALVFCTPLFASSVHSLFSEVYSQYVDMLLDGYSLNSTTIDGGAINHLAPLGTVARERALEAEKEENAFSIIRTAFVPYPENWKAMSFEEKRVALMNVLTAISTQKGIQYISRTAGNKPQTLFSESYLVSDPTNKKSRTEDPVYTSVPESFILYSYQKDNRFGGNFYSLDYTVMENEVFLNIGNLTDMKFMGIKCVEKNSLHLYMDAVLAEEGIVICSMATVYDQKPKVNLVFYTVDLENSFSRRLDALKDWFAEEIQKT